jgi:hypothetical protein
MYDMKMLKATITNPTNSTYSMCYSLIIEVIALIISSIPLIANDIMMSPG